VDAAMLTGLLRTMDFDSDSQDTATLTDDRVQHWIACVQKVAEKQDNAAFRELFDHFSPMVKSFAWKVPSLDHPDTFAEELLQETMLKVWTKAASFDPKLASPSTWIFTIARNMRIDLLRKQARHVVNSVSLYQDDEDGELDLEDIWFEDENSDVFNLLAQQRSRRQIHESLKLLPAEQTEVLVKVYLEDKSHAEVAAELKLPLGTVKSRVRLALNKLKLVVDR
jgi:RNA polymerase sigma-70 factor (ECF subfamily)